MLLLRKRDKDADRLYMQRKRARFPEYSPWQKMIQRCTNPNQTGYDNYGGRRIRVCARWRGANGFACFLADMGPRPSRQHSIDRYPNNNGDYEPSNCRWATRRQQDANKRTNFVIAFRGKSQSVTEWALELGLHESTLFKRLHNGWGRMRALTSPADVAMRNGQARRLSTNAH